jgi:hypothetical protein
MPLYGDEHLGSQQDVKCTIRISVIFRAMRLKFAKILLYWIAERVEKAALAS